MRLSPTVRISLALVLLTSSVFMIGHFVGLTPDERNGLIEGRRKFCEFLAVNITYAAREQGITAIEKTLKVVAERNADVLSIAIRNTAGELMVEAGDHASNWPVQPLQELSTADRVQIPVFKEGARWGTVEVAFSPLSESFAETLTQTSFGLMFFVAGLGFFVYLAFIRKALRELDPGAVIPERVRSAFNCLAEGLLLMDEKERIILANEAFAETVRTPARDLVGAQASSLDWDADRLGDQSNYPWKRSIREHRRQTGIPMVFKYSDDGSRTLMVNAAPVLDNAGATRGVLATFNDMTALEKKHSELKRTLKHLRRSEEELRDKTLELQYLATRDPLTGCLNRRAFLEKYESKVADATQLGTQLVNIMMDIDNFKSVNDRFGHIAGDKVLQLVAELLRSNSRPDDLVGRYGGEEFCIVLPETNLDTGLTIAERLREAIAEGAMCFKSSITVTASFGVAELSGDISKPADLIKRADIALYAAKASGRNRVISWQPDLIAVSAPVSGHVAVAPGASQNESLVPHEDTEITENEPSPDAELKQCHQRIAELTGELDLSKQLSKRDEGLDTLTGLPNRLLFADRIRNALARSARNKGVVALISLDVDAFKRVNDALGHVVGDQLLRTLSNRLVNTLRSSDTVSFLGVEQDKASISRLGSDEFGILLSELNDVDSIPWIVKRIFDNLSRKIEIDGHEIFVNCSAGVSVYPHDAESSEALLQNASAARNDAKQRFGRNNVRFFSAEINKAAYRQLWLETQLHNAMRAGELKIHYQPQVDIRTMQIRGLEALLRWQHPKLGFIPPVEFIRIAERAGLIAEMGEWVLREACQQTKNWLNQGYSDLIICVNLSSVQFRQNDLAEKIQQILKETQFPNSQIELEITETAVMDSVELAMETISKLHEAGVRFAIDDFGTGYSSLSSLKDLRVDTLKIDRSFIVDSLPDRHGQLIISAIVSMAQSLGLRVVAEGVETETQMAFLRDLNCDQYQGYLFSKPVPPRQVAKLLQNHYRPATGTAA